MVLRGEDARGVTLQFFTSSFREFCLREIRYVSSSPYTMHVWLVGVRGPGIAELCSVASRVARETQPPYLLILVRDCFA